MARVSDGVLPDDAQLGLTLDRYAEIMLLDTCAFNGVLKPPCPDHSCQDIWTQSQRDKLAMFLLEAEEMREEELGYFLAHKYVYKERHDWGNPVILNKKFLQGIGERVTDDIELGVAIDHGVETDPNDPVEISVATTVTDASEICVYYPGEDVKINPSSVSIAGGVATIKIPRCRLVKPELNDDREDHLDYYDNDNFLETVDVKRCWLDESLGAELVWKYTNSTCHPNCTSICQSACPQVEDQRGWRLSIVHLHPATYSNGSWTGVAFSQNTYPHIVRVSYMSGKQTLRNEHLTARMAHALMPHSPCNCDAVNMYWQTDRDRDPSNVITPYGASVAAVECWLADSRARIGMGGKFPGMRR